MTEETILDRFLTSRYRKDIVVYSRTQVAEELRGSLGGEPVTVRMPVAVSAAVLGESHRGCLCSLAPLPVLRLVLPLAAVPAVVYTVRHLVQVSLVL